MIVPDLIKAVAAGRNKARTEIQGKVMNKRIAELYDQAIVLEGNGDYVAGELDPVKFAELIIRECAKIADDGFASSNFGNGITGHQLLKHFGVN